MSPIFSLVSRLARLVLTIRTKAAFVAFLMGSTHLLSPTLSRLACLKKNDGSYTTCTNPPPAVLLTRLGSLGTFRQPQTAMSVNKKNTKETPRTHSAESSLDPNSSTSAAEWRVKMGRLRTARLFFFHFNKQQTYFQQDGPRGMTPSVPSVGLDIVVSGRHKLRPLSSSDPFGVAHEGTAV